MNISATGTATGANAAAMIRPQGQRGGRPDDAKLLSPVADRLGMSVSELKTAMQGGSTLDQLAGTKGVSRADLVASIKEGLAAGKPAGAPELSTEQLDELAETISVGAMPGAGGPGGPGGPMGAPPAEAPRGQNRADGDTVESVAKLLQMSTTDLLDSLTSGTSLSELAKDKGVSFQSLLDTVSSGMVIDTTA